MCVRLLGHRYHQWLYQYVSRHIRADCSVECIVLSRFGDNGDTVFRSCIQANEPFFCNPYILLCRSRGTTLDVHSHYFRKSVLQSALLYRDSTRYQSLTGNSRRYRNQCPDWFPVALPVSIRQDRTDIQFVVLIGSFPNNLPIPILSNPVESFGTSISSC